jgi:hypothetical protein
MTHRTHSLRYAGSAIAAALALASTSSLAQDPSAQFPAAPQPVPVPEIVVPDIPAPASPEPTVVLPAEAPETAAVADPAGETTEAEPTQTAPVARTRAAQPSERAARATEAAPVVATAEPAPSGETLPSEVAAAPLPPLAIEQEPARNSGPDIGILALVLGGLVFLALAIWGFVAIGRRKPGRRYAAVAPQPTAVPPVVNAPIVAGAEDLDARPARPVVEPLATPVPSAGALSHTGASVALPRSLPHSYEEREALFRRMVDAKPDRANPFTDRKARMKRARLIMQSIGRDFGDAEPWIDLSQYPQNWPELAQRRSAAA